MSFPELGDGIVAHRLAAGPSRTVYLVLSDETIVRVDHDGRLDTTFEFRPTSDIEGFNTFDAVVPPTGTGAHLVAIGWVSTTGFVGITPDGTLDEAFGTDGTNFRFGTKIVPPGHDALGDGSVLISWETDVSDGLTANSLPTQGVNATGTESVDCPRLESGVGRVPIDYVDAKRMGDGFLVVGSVEGGVTRLLRLDEACDPVTSFSSDEPFEGVVELRNADVGGSFEAELLTRSVAPAADRVFGVGRRADADGPIPDTYVLYALDGTGSAVAAFGDGGSSAHTIADLGDLEGSGLANERLVVVATTEPSESFFDVSLFVHDSSDGALSSTVELPLGSRSCFVRDVDARGRFIYVLGACEMEPVDETFLAAYRPPPP